MHKNRRVLRLVPAPTPLRKNIRNIDTRRSAMNAFAAYAMLSLIAFSSGAGVCSAAFVMHEQGVNWLIASAVTLIGTVALLIGSVSMKAAIATWFTIEVLDEKSRVRNRLLATVVRPIEDKLQVPFHDWMQ
jgi:hypothetical protein